MALRERHNLEPIYNWRGYFYIAPLLIMTFCFWNEYEHDLITWSVGLPFMALGLVIRVWATKHSGKRIPRKYNEGRRRLLIVTGPYRLVRNPLYVGNIVTMIGLCLLSELVWFMPIVVTYFFLLYSLVVRYEECRLSALFEKDYEIYRQKVPRWMARLSMIGESKRGGFSWTSPLRAPLSINFSFMSQWNNLEASKTISGKTWNVERKGFCLEAEIDMKNGVLEFSETEAMEKVKVLPYRISSEKDITKEFNLPSERNRIVITGKP